MKSFYVYTFVLLVATVGLQPCFAKLAASQQKNLREIAKNLPVTDQQLDEFFENFDGIQAWVEADILATKVVPKQTESCNLCVTLIGLGLSVLRSNVGMDVIKDFLSGICSLFLAQDVCVGAVNMYAGPLEYILKEKSYLRALDLCGIYTGTVGGCDPINSTMRDWTITVNPNKPALLTPPLLPDSTPTAKILHLTDIHPDLHYVVGSNKNCGKPMCCRGEVVPDTTLQAGPHGDDLCDMPKSALDELFLNAKNRYEEYAFVLMTGDLVHHLIWGTTKEDNIAHYDVVNKPLVEELFINTPVYPVIGNHEPHPCNMFPPQSVWGVHDDYDVSWVYNHIADSYAKWLGPHPGALESFRRAGYYTLKIPNNGPRLVAINTNFCYINNFWIFYDSIDPEGQLQWLSNTLQAAETAGEVVYIAGHIPPGKGDCWNVWNGKFDQIIIRYENIIKAQFYGHTHNDETTIFFDKSVSPPRPANTLNIGVSTTAYTHLNPGYKVFHADGARGADSTWEMLNHETWVYNLTAANLAGASVPPNWYKLYSMREAFNLPSLRPEHLYDMVVKMIFDDALFQKYYEYFHKGSHLRERCDIFRCKMDFLCEIVKADSGDFSHCVRLFEIADTTPPPEEMTTPQEEEESTGFALPKSQTNMVTILAAVTAAFLLRM